MVQVCHNLDVRVLLLHARLEPVNPLRDIRQRRAAHHGHLALAVHPGSQPVSRLLPSREVAGADVAQTLRAGQVHSQRQHRYPRLNSPVDRRPLRGLPRHHDDALGALGHGLIHSRIRGLDVESRWPQQLNLDARHLLLEQRHRPFVLLVVVQAQEWRCDRVVLTVVVERADRGRLRGRRLGRLRLRCRGFGGLGLRSGGLRGLSLNGFRCFSGSAAGGG